jgi:hypothetical protein
LWREIGTIERVLCEVISAKPAGELGLELEKTDLECPTIKEKAIQIPSLTASAANANGFVQTPQLESAWIFWAPAVFAGALPIGVIAFLGIDRKNWRPFPYLP